MTLAIISSPACDRHEMGDGHPESPLRLDAIRKHLQAVAPAITPDYLDAPVATRAQLARVHSGTHIDTVFATAPDEGYAELDPDTWMNKHTLTAALHAAGAAVLAVDRVMAGKNHAAFCNVRPPGHHAERNRAMGFCFFNNVAIAATHALEQWSLQRVAIVDFDVHHGNGTQDVFENNPRVMLCSTFQSPLYPYSGTGRTPEHIVNLPLPAGTDGAQYRKAVSGKLLPALESFQPELVLFSAGFDAHIEDPLANLRLVEEDYAWITREVRAVALRHAQGRIVSTLEGGYALGALGRSVVAHLQEMV